MTQEELEKIAAMVAESTIFATKELLTLDEAARYMGVKKSHLYRLTSQRSIPHYKPSGKMCYFKRAELDEWLTGNPVATSSELERRAQAYCMRKGNTRKTGIRTNAI